jgi:hypothetical protein
MAAKKKPFEVKKLADVVPDATVVIREVGVTFAGGRLLHDDSQPI